MSNLGAQQRSTKNKRKRVRGFFGGCLYGKIIKYGWGKRKAAGRKLK